MNKLLLSYMCLACLSMQAQTIVGPNPVNVSTQNIYTYVGNGISAPGWELNSIGRIISTNQNGITYQCTILWHTAGQGLITFKDGTVIKRTLTVPVLSDVLLPPTVTNGERCGPGTVTLSATPGAGGNGINWYLEDTTPVATVSTTYTTPSLTTTQKYYAATYNSVTGKQSSPLTPIWAIIKPVPTAPVIVNDKRIGPGTLSLTNTTGELCQWFNPAGNLLATGYTYVTPNIESSTLKYLYVKKFVNGCLSEEQTWVNVTIDPQPKPTITNDRIIMGAAVSMDAGDGYSSYLWKDANGSTLGNNRFFQTSEPGTYNVIVTKTGFYGTGASVPIRIYSQLEEQEVNVIAVNKLLFATKDAKRIENLGVDSISQRVQYFDGLGRTIQTIETQASPSKSDVIVPNSFDAFGREVKKFLPYVDTGDGTYKSDALGTNNDPDELIRYRSGKQYTFYQSNSTIAKDMFPYTETIPESGGLARPLQQGAPGKVWQPNLASSYQSPASTGKAILFSYEFNGANEVLLWRHVPSPIFSFGLINAGTASALVYYQPNKLYKNRTKDENRNEVISYIDTEGKVILKRVQIVAGTNLPINDTNFASTYYVYDNFGQLICVLPPEAVKNINTQYHHSAATYDTKNSFLNLWSFRYLYDDKFRMAQKKVPGAKPVYIVYDSRNRMVLTQDGNQRNVASREWIFTKYDAFNRPVATGFYSSTDSLSVLQSKLDASPNAKFESYSGSGSYFGYTNQSFPTTAEANLYQTITYYDKYDNNIAPSGFTHVNESLPGQESPVNNAMAQVTGTLSRNQSTLVMQRTVNYYDQKKRSVQAISQHHRSGTVRTTMVYDFAGNVLFNHKTYTIGTTTTKTKESNKYDHAGRLITRRHSVNGAAEIILASHVYNDIGQLREKQMHNGGSGGYMQSLDYRYNIRGWLTKMNEPNVSAIATGDVVHDFFGMELLYDAKITGISSTSAFNGNISAMQWSKGSASKPVVQLYTFAYDPASRLRSATHYDREFDFITAVASWKTNGNQFGEALTYDHNGNIATLSRKGIAGSSLDNLTYFYSGNALRYVNDGGDNTTGFVNGNTGTDDYSYDNNGNLNKDRNKGLNAAGDIRYNFLNLPVEVAKGTEKVKYIYDATGLKLSQEVYNSSGSLSKVTDYVGEMILEGTTSATTLKMIMHPEGRVLPNGTGWEYQYYMKDHLGNVRLTFTSKPQVTTTLTANFESASNNNFLNYTNHTFDLVDHTDAGTTYKNTQYLTGLNRVGLAKTYVVMPGDKISVSAYVKYMNLSTTTNTTTFISSLAQAFNVSPTSTGEAGKLYSALNNYAGIVLDGHPDDDDSGPPKAFITILFFDKNYKLLDAAWDQVDVEGEQTSPIVKQPHDLVSVSANAPDAGYAYVFLSNEHPTLVDVYFDDVTMSVLPSAIVGMDDYYPFGMTYNSSRRQNGVAQDYLYNGKEFQDELNLNWYDYQARQYDPSVGRFLSIDPLSDSSRRWSLYTYGYDNPIRFIDPDGMAASDQTKDPYLLFDGGNKSIEIWDDGDTPDDYSDDVYIGSYDAKNDVTSSSNGKWEDGKYEMVDKQTPKMHGNDTDNNGVLKDSDNGSYGSGGIFRAINFTETTTGLVRTGMGLHAGRENLNWANSRLTLGCIRLKPDGFDAIVDAINNYGPLQKVIVTNNRQSNNSGDVNGIAPGSDLADDENFWQSVKN